ncbi:MAG TPA: class F sortase [Dehalococcoidia bacterium]
MGRTALSQTLSLAVIGTGAAALLLAATLAMHTASSRGAPPQPPHPGVGFNTEAILEPAILPPITPGMARTPPAPPTWLRIPVIGVDAPVVEKGLRADLVMESPDGPWEVAWYRFTARPGEGGNAVFSGHVDYVGVGPAVFWELGLLAPGDVVEVDLADGRTLRYQVVAIAVYDEATAPVPEIIGPTAREAVTLITCAGNFNRRTGRYDQRLVVRAERVPDGT